MNLTDFNDFIKSTFGNLVEQFKENDEYGYNNPQSQDIIVVGFTTNLTPDVVHKAVDNKVQFIITHHDAWDFLYEVKEQCVKELIENEISHFYIHLPLDCAEFGTCNSLLQEIGISKITQQTHYEGNHEIIGIGEYNEPIAFEELVDRISTALAEDVKAWKNSNTMIKKVGIVTGAGNSTDLIRQAKEAECDVYITGEKSLYSVQYAKFAGINLIVGSHTFTEIFGVKSLVERLKAAFNEIETIYLEEEHVE
ncbi:Nif3-like dinuclear metal center hexameric protein [Paenibacillus sp. NPDC058177]|uniref:Nif3-like dinuclear metal center hexameric protein n=1 Tax=Paenibacillus sp. NPDC058177 TaxID=3346369 RepID=UPI0036DC5B4D